MRPRTYLTPTETYYNAANIFQGQLDSILACNGVVQAEKTGKFLKEELDPATVFVSSDLRRAIHTAEVVLHCLHKQDPRKAHHYELDTRQGIRERDLGCLSSMEKQEAMRGQEWAKMQDPNVAPTGGESYNAFEARVVDAFEDIAECYKDATSVLVVTHGGVLSALKTYILGNRGDRDFVPGRNANCSISLVQKDQEKWSIVDWNNTSHLVE